MIGLRATRLAALASLAHRAVPCGRDRWGIIALFAAAGAGRIPAKVAVLGGADEDRQEMFAVAELMGSMCT